MGKSKPEVGYEYTGCAFGTGYKYGEVHAPAVSMVKLATRRTASMIVIVLVFNPIPGRMINCDSHKSIRYNPRDEL